MIDQPALGLPAEPHLVARFQSLSQKASSVALLIGVAMLAGCSLGNAFLKQLPPGWLPVKPNAAVCFVLSGLALWLLQPSRAKRPGNRLLAQGCALIITGVGLLTILEYVLHVNLGLDPLLLRWFPEAAAPGLHPGRVTPLTASILTLSGAALWLLDVEGRGGTRPAQFLGLGSLALSLLGAFGYIYGAFVFLGYRLPFTAMSGVSVLGCLSTSLGILFARPDRGWMRLIVSQGPGGMTARRLLLAVLCLSVTLDLLTEAGQKAAWYDTATQTALHGFLTVLAFGWLVYRLSGALAQMDRQRRKTEQVMRESEATHRLLFENSPQPMYAYDVNSLAFLAVNDAAIEQYGYRREEFLAMSLTDLRLPEDVPALLEVVPKLQRKETTGHLWRHRKKDGTIIWVQVNSHALPFGGRSARLALATDITERKRAEEALREAELRYRTLFAQSPDGVLTIDPTTTLPLEFNDAAYQQSGYSREEFARLRLTDHDPVATPQEIQASIANIVEGHPRDFEVKHRTKQGELRAVHVTAQRIELSGRPVIHCIWRDITERKKAEAEREMLFASLQEALTNVKTLSGLLPICAGCKKIRDDQGYWNRIEIYIQKHSSAQFTHGLCPDCIKRLYPDLNLSAESH